MNSATDLVFGGYLAGEVVGVPLYGEPPDGLHGHGDAGHQRVRQDQLEHQEVHVRFAPEQEI
jgi:hypothetical protein